MQKNPQIADFVVENMMSAIIMLDEDLIVRYINVATEQLFRLSARKFIGHALPQVLEYTNFDFERLKNCCQEHNGYSDYEVKFFIEGTPLLVEIDVISIEPKAEFDNCVIMLELRKIEQQHKMNIEQQQHAQQIAAQDLVRGLAHEIKNPLGGLRGAAQLLDRQFKGQADVHEYTSIIIEQADRLKHLVDRLLGPQKRSTHTLCNIHEIIEKVRKLVSMDIGNKITIQRDYDPSIPEFSIDADQMQQAILNIVCNACQCLQENHTPDSTIIIKTRTAYRVNIHGNIAKIAILIQIIDNGPGIPAKIRDTLFYPMVTGRNGGTGLGLSIAQNIIDQHEGKIECVSWKGHTEFSIFLPIKE